MSKFLKILYSALNMEYEETEKDEQIEDIPLPKLHKKLLIQLKQFR